MPVEVNKLKWISVITCISLAADPLVPEINHFQMTDRLCDVLCMMPLYDGGNVI